MVWLSVDGDITLVRHSHKLYMLLHIFKYHNITPFLNSLYFEKIVGSWCFLMHFLHHTITWKIISINFGVGWVPPSFTCWNVISGIMMGWPVGGHYALRNKFLMPATIWGQSKEHSRSQQVDLEDSRSANTLIWRFLNSHPVRGI